MQKQKYVEEQIALVKKPKMESVVIELEMSQAAEYSKQQEGEEPVYVQEAKINFKFLRRLSLSKIYGL